MCSAGPSKLLRSKAAKLENESRNKHVLPAVCSICKSTKYVISSVSRRRGLQTLVQCETDAITLKLAAEKKQDESILMQIRYQDPVAVEVKYHESCNRDYTRFLTKPVNTITS
jgi:hypothetical protein